MKKILTLISFLMISFLALDVNAAENNELTFSYLDSNNTTIEETINNVNNLVITTGMIRFQSNSNVVTYQFPDIRNNNPSFKLSYKISNDRVLAINGGLINNSKHNLNAGDIFEIENKEYKINGNVIDSIKSGSYQFNFLTPNQNELFSDTPLTNYFIKHRYSINQSINDYVHGLDLVINKSDLEWVENNVHEIPIPNSYKVHFKNASYEEPNPRMEYLTKDSIKLKAIRTSGGSEVYEITINDIYVGRLVNNYTFSFYSEDLTTVNIYYADSNKWVFRQAFIATENSTFDTVSNFLENYKNVNHELLEHQVFKFLTEPGNITKYFDEDNDIAIIDSDIITSNMKIYQKVGYSENTIININYETNIPDKIIDLVHSYNLKDYLENPTDTYTLNDLGYQFPILEYEGYTFSHWEVYQNSQWKKVTLTTSLKGNIILKAIFVDESKPIEVKIDYGSGIQVFEILPGQSIPYDQLEIPAKVSKRFVGFSFHRSHPNDSEHSHFIDLENEVFVSDKRVYAIYEDVIYYNVTFDVDGGVYIPPMKVRANTNNFAAELPEAVKSKHIFLGWFLDKELIIPAPTTKINKYDPESIKYYDITLYASYHNNGSKVYFHTNTIELEISPIVITKGQSINISTPPKRLGYIFEGWFLDELLTNEYLGEPIEVDEVNLYAKWSIDESNPPEIEEESSDNYNLYIYIIIGVMVVGGYMLFKPKKKYRRRRR